MCLLSSAPAAAQRVFLESGGRVVVEAENFSSRIGVDERNWYIVPEEAAGTPTQFANFRGAGYVQALPDGAGASGSLQPPLIQYRIYISTVGTYRLFVRWDSFSDQSDTFYASVVELRDGTGGLDRGLVPLRQDQ